MTMERLREFGVLLSVGMKRGSLSMVILLETLFISSIGAVGGHRPFMDHPQAD